MKKLLLPFTAISSCPVLMIAAISATGCYAQNGHILHSERRFESDSMIFHRIVYLSDSIPVEGFIVQPVREANYTHRNI
jgi:hypothetical protein